MAMKHSARTLAGLLLGSFLFTVGVVEIYAQGTVQGPWLNDPATGQSTTAAGWRAKRPASGTIPAQATVSAPWPGAARTVSTPSGPSTGYVGTGTASTTGVSSPPGFWSPAAPSSPVVRMAQQPSPASGPSGATAEPAPTPAPAPKPAINPIPEAPAPINGRPSARPVPQGQPGGPEVIPPGQPSPIYPQDTEQIPMPYPGTADREGAWGSDCEDGLCEGPCFGPWWGPGAYWGYSLFSGLFRDLTLFGGAHAFKGPVDGGVNSNFGLHEGLNFSGPLGDPWGGGFQIGFQAVHSNFRGYARRIYDGSVGGTAVSEPALDIPPEGVLANNSFIVPNGDRDQLFFTAGLFRRAPMGGLQWGVVFDLMHDAYYYTSDLKQIRAEMSLVCPGWREIGFWGAFGVGNERVSQEFTYRRQDTQQDITYQLDYTLEPTDQFNFFYRQYFQNGGEGRLWVGFTSNSDFLLGGDLWIPLSTHFALENSFNILFPKETGQTAQREQAWSVMIQLVWYPGRCAKASPCNIFRPLFGVADNTSFLLDRQTNSVQ